MFVKLIATALSSSRQSCWDFAVPFVVAIASAKLTHVVAARYCSKRAPFTIYVPAPTDSWAGYLVGHIIPIIKEEFGAPHRRALRRVIAANGPKATTFAWHLWPGKHRILVAHPADMEHILLENGSNYVKAPDYDVIEEIAGKHNLVSMRDEKKHSQQRRLVAPAFNPVTLKHIADDVLRAQLEKHLQELAQTLAAHPDDPVPLDEVLDSITLATIAEASFKQTNLVGTDIQFEFRRVLANFGVSILGLFRIYRQYFPGKAQRETKSAIRNIRALGAQIAVDIRQQSNCKSLGATSGGSGGTESTDRHQQQQSGGDRTLIDILVREEGLTSEELIDHIGTFLFAGHETTSKGLLWTVYLLAANPQIQNQLYEELCSAVSLTAVPSLDTVKDLPLLGHCIKESLRLYPPIPFIVRRSVHDDVLPYSGAYVPAGWDVVVQPSLVHQLKLIYGEDADEFRPDRWNKEEGLVEKIGPCGWMPFIVGKRNCIGKDFAWNELLVTVAALFRRFKVAVPEGYPRPEKQMKISLRPKERIPFLLSPRTE